MKLQITTGYTYTFQKRKLVEYFLGRASALPGEPADEFFYRFLYCPSTGQYTNRFLFYSRGRRILALERPYVAYTEEEIWSATLEEALLRFRQWFLTRPMTVHSSPLLSEEYVREACAAAAAVVTA